MGGIGSGAQPHWHGLAWNWLVHGRKEWLLWPPQEATYALRHVLLSADAAANATVPPLRCTQLAGEVLIVPQLWGPRNRQLGAGARLRDRDGFRQAL